jgi:hypothetical protein
MMSGDDAPTEWMLSQGEIRGRWWGPRADDRSASDPALFGQSRISLTQPSDAKHRQVEVFADVHS